MCASSMKGYVFCIDDAGLLNKWRGSNPTWGRKYILMDLRFDCIIIGLKTIAGVKGFITPIQAMTLLGQFYY